jgi:hypothetical protein
MARSRAALSLSVPEFDEAWRDDEFPDPRARRPKLRAYEGGRSDREERPARRVVDWSQEDPIERERYHDPPAARADDAHTHAALASGRVPGVDDVPGRRTVTIRGQVAPRPTPRRPSRRADERFGSRPDRVAMWAVLLCVVMILVAATSSHAAMVHSAQPALDAARAAVTHLHAHVHAAFHAHP